MLVAPELHAGLWVGCHQSRAEGQNPLPWTAGHTAFDAAQDTIGLQVCEWTLVAHDQLFIHQYPQVLLDRAALNPFVPQPVMIPEVAPTQVCRTLHLALLNLMRLARDHFSSLSMSLWMASCPSGVSTAPLSLVSSANLLKVHRISFSRSLMKMLNCTGPWSQYRPLRETACHLSTSGHRAIDHYPLDAIIQPIPCAPNSPPIKSIFLQSREEDVVGDCVKGLTKVQISNIHSSALVHWYSLLAVVPDFDVILGPYRGIWKKAVLGHTLLWWCSYRHLRTWHSWVSLAHCIFSPFFLCEECVRGEIQHGRQYIKTWITGNMLYFAATGRPKQPRTSSKSLASSSFSIFTGGMKT